MGRDRRIFSILVACVSFGSFAGCQSAPADFREWRPTDHDHTDNPGAGQVDGGRPPAAMLGIDEVTLAAWKGNCTVCHGLVGRGDGPKGPSVKTRDLTDAAWQAEVSDEQLASSIKKGKGQMKAFDLPDSTIKGLVRLVRLLSSSRMPANDESEDDNDEAADETAVDAGAKARDAGKADAAKARDAALRDAAKPRLDAAKPAAPTGP